MSKRSNISLTNQNKDAIPIPPNYANSHRNIPLNPKISDKSKNNHRKENYKMKFTYISKNNYLLNNTDNNSNNFIDSKNLSKDNLKDINKDKESNYSTNNEKRSDIISIFDPKRLLIKNNEKINSPRNNTNNYLLISNNKKSSKGNIIISSKNKRFLPQRYQLNLDNNSSNNNNSILIGNKMNLDQKNRIIKLEEKYKKILDNKDKGRVITLEDISIIGDKKKILKKCLSKPNYISDKNYNNYNSNNINNNTNNYYLSNNIARCENIETFNSEKIVKHRSIRSNYKNNNLYSYQTQAPRKEILNKNRKANMKSYTINIKNHSQIFDRNNNNYIYPKDMKVNRRSNQNIFKDFIDKEKSKSKSKSKNRKTSAEIKMKNQVNNNNININNVFINLDNKNKDYFSNENTFKPLIREELNKNSFVNIYNKSNSNKELTINNNQLLNDIKQLWKKIGGVTEYYKINFSEKLNYLSNDDKIYFYIKEKEEIDNLLILLEKLNKNIKSRNAIHTQLKNLSSNNYIKIEDISRLLISLRMATIDVINDFINFKKAISYDILNNKYILSNINNYPYNYLYQLENDNSYLYTHEYLSTFYKFSKYPDPFLLSPSRENKEKNNKYIILPITDFTLQEIQKANYFLMKEKINRDDRKRSIIKNPGSFCNNNTILIRNNTGKKTNEKKPKLNNGNNGKENKFENILICPKVTNLDYDNNNNKINKNILICKDNFFDIKNNGIKIFKKNLNVNSNITNFNIIDNFNNKNKDKNNKNNLPCSNIVNYEIINNNKSKNNNILLCNISNFEIKSIPKVIKKEQNYSISSKTENFEIKNNKITKEEKLNKNILPCSKIVNFEIMASNKNINKVENKNISDISQTNPQSNKLLSQANNANNSNKEHAPQNKPKNNLPKVMNPTIISQVCPYDEKTYPPIELIYNAYLKTVSNDIKISFKIIPDIYYYSSIGVSPKIVLFKQNNTILYGMATLSYDSTQIYHRALIITSISCSNNYSITKTLLQLVDYCDREIEYDELILYLYFYQSETNKGEYILNEEFQNIIKTQTKFKWTALENTGNERKIKYHYKKSFSQDKGMINPNTNIIKMVKNYTQIRFYRFIKYNKTSSERGLNAKDHTFLFNVLNLIFKYGKEPDNKDDELNIMFTKISGLKKKRLLKMITEFNYVIYNKLNAFIEELGKNEDKKFSEILFKRFLPLIQNMEKNKFFGLYYCDISTNFSSIFKKRINNYEYNIISIKDLNIEVFRLSNEQTNDDFNNYLYFFKSENESISFILYELNSIEEKGMENIDENSNYKNDLFNKLLKRILTKDNEEPVKYFKKIGIPSFRYHPALEKESTNQYKIIDYEVLDGDDWFDFCIENNNNENLFSFPERNIINDDVKIIENNFVIAIINPDLTVDYHIPALNIYYINKNCWIKR